MATEDTAQAKMAIVLSSPNQKVPADGATLLIDMEEDLFVGQTLTHPRAENDHYREARVKPKLNPPKKDNSKYNHEPIRSEYKKIEQMVKSNGEEVLFERKPKQDLNIKCLPIWKPKVWGLAVLGLMVIGMVTTVALALRKLYDHHAPDPNVPPTVVTVENVTQAVTATVTMMTTGATKIVFGAFYDNIDWANHVIVCVVLGISQFCIFEKKTASAFIMAWTATGTPMDIVMQALCPGMGPWMSDFWYLNGPTALAVDLLLFENYWTLTAALGSILMRLGLWYTNVKMDLMGNSLWMLGFAVLPLVYWIIPKIWYAALGVTKVLHFPNGDTTKERVYSWWGMFKCCLPKHAVEATGGLEPPPDPVGKPQKPKKPGVGFVRAGQTERTVETQESKTKSPNIPVRSLCERGFLIVTDGTEHVGMATVFGNYVMVPYHVVADSKNIRLHVEHHEGNVVTKHRLKAIGTHMEKDWPEPIALFSKPPSARSPKPTTTTQGNGFMFTYVNHEFHLGVGRYWEEYHDVSTDPGTSGSPMFNTLGQLVGMHRAGAVTKNNMFTADQIVRAAKAAAAAIGETDSEEDTEESGEDPEKKKGKTKNRLRNRTNGKRVKRFKLWSDEEYDNYLAMGFTRKELKDIYDDYIHRYGYVDGEIYEEEGESLGKKTITVLAEIYYESSDDEPEPSEVVAYITDYFESAEPQWFKPAPVTGKSFTELIEEGFKKTEVNSSDETTHPERHESRNQRKRRLKKEKQLQSKNAAGPRETGGGRKKQ